MNSRWSVVGGWACGRYRTGRAPWPHRYARLAEPPAPRFSSPLLPPVPVARRRSRSGRRRGWRPCAGARERAADAPGQSAERLRGHEGGVDRLPRRGGGGKGTLTFQGQSYPFDIAGTRRCGGIGVSTRLTPAARRTARPGGAPLHDALRRRLIVAAILARTQARGLRSSARRVSNPSRPAARSSRPRRSPPSRRSENRPRARSSSRRRRRTRSPT